MPTPESWTTHPDWKADYEFAIGKGATATNAYAFADKRMAKRTPADKATAAAARSAAAQPQVPSNMADVRMGDSPEIMGASKRYGEWAANPETGGPFVDAYAHGRVIEANRTANDEKLAKFARGVLDWRPDMRSDDLPPKIPQPASANADLGAKAATKIVKAMTAPPGTDSPPTR